MQSLEFRSQCSDVLFAVIEAMRGDIERNEFLMCALTVGLGHMQEEILSQQRQSVYEKLTIGSDRFNKALGALKLTPAERPDPPTPFGRDITRPKAVS